MHIVLLMKASYCDSGSVSRTRAYFLLSMKAIATKRCPSRACDGSPTSSQRLLTQHNTSRINVLSGPNCAVKIRPLTHLDLCSFNELVEFPAYRHSIRRHPDFSSRTFHCSPLIESRPLPPFLANLSTQTKYSVIPMDFDCSRVCITGQLCDGCKTHFVRLSRPEFFHPN